MVRRCSNNCYYCKASRVFLWRFTLSVQLDKILLYKIIEIRDDEIVFRNLEAKDKVIPIIDIIEISKRTAAH